MAWKYLPIAPPWAASIKALWPSDLLPCPSVRDVRPEDHDDLGLTGWEKYLPIQYHFPAGDDRPGCTVYVCSSGLMILRNREDEMAEWFQLWEFFDCRSKALLVFDLYLDWSAVNAPERLADWSVLEDWKGFSDMGVI